VLIGILAGLAAGALWGLVFVAPRMVSGFTAVDFTAGRFVSYGALSVLFMLLWRKPALPTLAQAVTALGMSVLGFTGYYLILVFAIRDAGTEVPSLIIGTIPIWMMLLGKPVGLRWAALIPGLILTVLGLGLMVQSSHAASVLGVLVVPSGAHFWRGVAFAFVSMVFWTAFGLLNSRWLKQHPEVNATTWANWLGVATGLGALVMWMVAGSDTNVLLAQADIVQAAFICITTGVGCAWLATYLWNIASQRLSASLCGQLIVSETIFALVYSFIWDGRWPSLMQATACLLFACGILASIRAHR
jgi:drug/metabolite transporter (DMT)-like permease